MQETIRETVRETTQTVPDQSPQGQASCDQMATRPPESHKRARIEDLERQREHHLNAAVKCNEAIKTLMKYPRTVVDEILGATNTY